MKLPEGASIERTDAVLRRIVAIASTSTASRTSSRSPASTRCSSRTRRTTASSSSCLKPFDERHRSAKEISDELNAKIAGIKEGFAFALMPPPILGLGNGAGYLAIRRGPRRSRLRRAAKCRAARLQGAVMQTPGMGFPISSYQANVPQLDAEVDRVKAKAQGVALTELFDTLQVYLGSAYVNDFNLFGRTWQVIAQADGAFRGSVEDIANLRTRNDRGEMVPIGSMVKSSQTYGPDPVMRYNGYPAADFIGEADPTQAVFGAGDGQVREHRGARCCPTA